MLINIFRINYLTNIYFCNFRSALISAAPNSAIALHSVGRNPEGLSSNKKDTILVEPFVFNIHPILLPLNMYSVLNLGDSCQTIYDSKVKLKDSPINIRTTSLIDKSYWHQIRQFKITGSRYYSLFTYYTASKKTDEQWALKASKYFWPNTFSNKFVKHGIKYESVAIELFARDSKQNIVPCGFVTSYDYLWLGYSPDGIIVNNFNEPTKLIEIKCPYIGSTVRLQDVVEKVKFISKNADGSLTLNKKDAYYAQVQLVYNCFFLKNYHIQFVNFKFKTNILTLLDFFS